MKFSKLVALGTSVCAFALATPSFAQDAAAASNADKNADDQSSIYNDDIVITAQKFNSRLQDTPLSVSAFEGKDLAAAGVTDIRSLSRVAPELGVTTDNQYTKVAIRGVSSPAIGVADDQTVTVNVDGEYISRPIALNAGFFDVERIEVLKGPQGTLYGRNASGGAINIITAKPQLGKFGGFASGEYGNFNGIKAETALNLPLGDNIAVRFAGLINKHDPFTDNRSLNPLSGFSQSLNVKAVRGAIAGEFGKLKVYAGGEYLDIDQLQSTQAGFPLNGSSTGLVQLPRPSAAYTNPLWYTVPANFDVPDSFDRAKYPQATTGFLKSQQWAVRGRADYEFGRGVTLSYIGGYRNISTQISTVLESNANAGSPAAACTATSACNLRYVFPYPSFKSAAWSHEVRLAGDPAARLQWQLGGFRFFENVSEASSGLYGAQVAGGVYLNYHYQPIKSSSWAGYGQATYWIIPDKFGITGGLRYTADDKTGHFVEYGAQIGFGATPPGINDTTRPNRRLVNNEAKSSRLTWLGRLEYKFSPDNMVYASVTEGYKAGGFDTVGSYKPEDVTAYEVGSRNRWGPITYNATAFYYNYRNQQANVLITFAIGGQTLNVGKSRYYGLEQDFGVKLSQNTNFRATVSYLDAKFTQFPNYPAPTIASPPGSGPPPITVDLSGNRPQQAPRWTITVGLDQTAKTSIGNFKFNVFTAFKSDYFLQVLNWRGDLQRSYTSTDASVDFTPAAYDKFSIGAFVRNVEDNRIKTFTGFTQGTYTFIFGAPRTYGVRARLNF